MAELSVCRMLRHTFFEGGDGLALIGDGQALERVMFVREGLQMPEGCVEDALAYGDVVRAIIDFLEGGEGLAVWQQVPDASPFMHRCWQEIAKIPYGETITYAQLAERAGNAKAVRAAGSACAKNHLPLLIPCHRVLGSGGGLGGFAWGLLYKEKLLALEAQEAERLVA